MDVVAGLRLEYASHDPEAATRRVNGMWCGQWQVGQTYDLSPNLASLLIVEGCARLEMRTGRNRRRAQRYPESERRTRR